MSNILKKIFYYAYFNIYVKISILILLVLIVLLPIGINKSDTAKAEKQAKEEVSFNFSVNYCKNNESSIKIDGNSIILSCVPLDGISDTMIDRINKINEPSN